MYSRSFLFGSYDRHFFTNSIKYIKKISKIFLTNPLTYDSIIQRRPSSLLGLSMGRGSCGSRPDPRSNYLGPGLTQNPIIWVWVWPISYWFLIRPKSNEFNGLDLDRVDPFNNILLISFLLTHKKTKLTKQLNELRN